MNQIPTFRVLRHRSVPVLVSVLACVLALTACSPSGPASSPPSSSSGFTGEQMAQIDAAAMQSLANGVTGTVVSVHDPKRGALLKAYGTADTAGTPMLPEMH
jgi:D-alanyl-D-alanine carboxypeptidase